MKGNVIDLAVAVVIGGAFGKIIASLVADIIMPLIGLLMGGVNFKELKWVINPAEVVNGVEKAATTLNYGNFIQVALDFLIIAFSIFLVIRLFTKFKKKEVKSPEPVKAPEPTKEEKLLTEIRDILKSK